MKFSLLFFNMIFIKRYQDIPINNLFVNQKLEKIGYINQRGELYYLNNEKRDQKYGTLHVKENKMFRYHENGEKWSITTPSRSFLSSKGHYLEKPDSSLLYNDFNDSFFQIYMNGDILQDGKKVNVNVNKKELWTSASVHNEEHVLYMNEQNEFYIHHIRDDYEMFKDTYRINSIGQKINVSRKGHFINVYILYPNDGVRVLRFFGGLHNFLSGFFISVPSCKDFSSWYPHLSVVTEDGEFKIWNIQHDQKYEMIYSKLFPDLKDDIEQMLQWNKIIYIAKRRQLLEFLLILV